jgi:formylmethanofuran dehydrogenase subunit E
MHETGPESNRPDDQLSERGHGTVIRSYTYEEYVEMVTKFHGYAAPGVIIGGFMVDLAYRNLPKDGLFDAISETNKCLPDAIQLLTPCTCGNGWLTVDNIGRYALTLYDKVTGVGVRVFVDHVRLRNWPEMDAWFFKRKPKKEQDMDLLQKEIREAGGAVMGVMKVEVTKRVLEKPRRGPFVLCPRCSEAYPAADGPVCLDCVRGSYFAAID